MEDLKKEHEKLRSKPVYIDLEEEKRAKIKSVKIDAAKIVRDYPQDTNTYGKKKVSFN